MSRISLVQHGWDDCYIPTSLEGFLDHLPTWKNLHILRAPELFDGTELLFPCNMFHDISGNSYLPALELGEVMNEGTYGKIHESRRALYRPDGTNTYSRYTPFHVIATKVNEIELTLKEKHLPPKEREQAYCAEIQANLHEATLHALVYHTLSKAGYPKSVPALYEVFAIGNQQIAKSPSEIQAIYMNMEYITGQTLNLYFHNNLPSGPHHYAKNERILTDILLQLCVYLDILQTDLRFNHRDLKIDNVVLRSQPSTWSRPIAHPLLPTPWQSTHDIVLLDFGFACVACGETNKSLIQAGCWFKPVHKCMKVGRDLALFLYCLEAMFPLRTRVSSAFYRLLEEAMIATIAGKRVPLFQGVEESGDPAIVRQNPLAFHEGIYKLLRRTDTEVPGCAPRVLLQSLHLFTAKN
jgi:serine/threonine protein kinase